MMAGMQRHLDNEWRVETPEHIAFVFRPAGIVPRALAWAIDFAFRLLLIVAIGFTTAFLDLDIAQAFVLLGWFVFEWFYGAWFESRPSGATLGKKSMGLQVIRTDGMPAGFAACFLRNLLRTADFLPAGFAFGLLAMFFGRGFRRLGDLAAGTLVVYSRRPTINPRLRSTAPELVATAADIPASVLARLDGETQRALGKFVAKTGRISRERQAEIALPLARVLRRSLPDLKVDDIHLLQAVYHRLDATADLSATNHTPKTQPASVDAYLASRAATWRRLNSELDDLKLWKRRKDKVVEFAHEYRSLCADLAIAETSPRNASHAEFLHDLVGRAHLRFYLPPRRRAGALKRVLLVQGPAALYRDPCLRIALPLFYGAFFGSMWLARLNPATAESFVGPGMLNSVLEMYTHMRDGRDLGTGTGMFAFYIRHNVGIALSCFATGIFAGLGSCITLVFNGLVLGFIFGWMEHAADPAHANFFEFVTAHGVFELTGIACSGAAGLRLGWGLVDTKGLPRTESLARSARKALPMIAAAAIMVAIAAPIEAFVSPSLLSLGIKRLVALVSLLVLVLYVGVLGYRAHQHLNVDEAGT